MRTFISYPPGAGGVTDGDKGDITVSGLGTVWTIDAGVVSNSKLANMPTGRFKARNDAGSGAPEDLTATEATALLDVFTDALKGLVPASGGGTTTFLRADGTFAIPPGAGGITDGDYGDIVVSGGGTVWTIDAAVVTFAKIQNIATDRLLGRDTAAAGSVEEITVGGGIEFTGSTGIQRSALTGDVTAAAGSGATTIANDAVTTAKIINDAVTFDKFQNINTDRLLGRDTAAAGNVEEISLDSTLTFSGAGVLGRAALTGDVTAAATSNSTTIANSAVTNAKMADMLASTIKGRAAGGGTGAPQDLTGTQTTAILDVFTDALKGLVPLSGGGTANYLRADGTWAAPPGTGGVSDGDKGDIVVSSAGTVWTIDNDVVTFAKFQNIGTDKLLGRDTAASGDVEEISLNATLQFDGSQNLQRSALTGDVTASAGSNATTIANDAVTTAKILNANVTFAKIQNIPTNSLIGRDSALSGVPEEILLNATLEMDGSLNLQRAALTGDVTASAGSNSTTIPNNTVTFAKMQDIATSRFVGRITAASGDPEELTGTQATTLIDTFTDLLKGLAPASGGGTTNYLRADGTWAAPPGTGGIADGDKGDITVSASGATWTIDNDVVTFAKMQNIATDRLIGRDTAASGDPEEVTISQAIDFIGSVARGDILYRNATIWTRLAAGTAGRFLQTSGAGADPVWADAVIGSGAVTDNQIVRFDGTSGNDIQNSVLVLADNGGITTSINTAATVTFNYLNASSSGASGSSFLANNNAGGNIAMSAIGTINSLSAAGDMILTVPAGNSMFIRAGAGAAANDLGIRIQDSVPGVLISTDVNWDAFRLLTVNTINATTNAVTYVEMLQVGSTGTPANGIGVGMEYNVETTADNFETGVTTEAVVTDVTAASEDFDFVVRLMRAGAAPSEALRVTTDWPYFTDSASNKMYIPKTLHLGSQHQLASTTATEVTGLSMTLVAGTYTFDYYLIIQSTSAGVGLTFSVNYTGTATKMVAWLTWPDTGVTAALGAVDDAALATTGQIVAHSVTRTEATSTTNLSTGTAGVATINVNCILRLTGIIVVSDGGDLELWHGSETATNTSVEVGSSLIVHRTA